MTLFQVTWEVGVEATSHRDAAQKALSIMRDPDSKDTVFEVAEWKANSKTVRIDLMDKEER